MSRHVILTGVDRSQNGRMSSEGLDVLLAFHVARGHVANVLQTLQMIQGISILVVVAVNVIMIQMFSIIVMLAGTLHGHSLVITAWWC